MARPSPSRSTASGVTQTLNYERPWLAEYQTQAIFGPERYAIVEASTKSGKTVACMVWLAEQAMQSQAGRNFWWIAPIYAQAKIAFRRLKKGLPPHVYRANESELTLTLLNGAVIWFKGAENPDSLYGEDVYAAVIDEFTRCKEDAWHAVRSTLTATRGPVRLIGNVKGRKNWGYKLARRAEAGAEGMRYTKITAADAVAAGILDEAEIADAKAVLPDAIFKELYEAEPSDDAGNPFGLGAIARCVAPQVDTPPISFGVDLAKSEDFTVVTGLDQAGQTCRFERWQGPWENTILRVGTMALGVPALVDSTGVGDPVLEALQKNGGNNFEGYKFTQVSKQKLMEGLAVAIQQEQITYPDGPIVLELESFEYEYTRTGVRYRAPEGMHDDCVMSLALAVRKHPMLGQIKEGWGVFEFTKAQAAKVVPNFGGVRQSWPTR